MTYIFNFIHHFLFFYHLYSPFIQYYTISSHTIPFNLILYRNVSSHLIPYLSIPFHSIPSHSISFHSIPFHSNPFYQVYDEKKSGGSEGGTGSIDSLIKSLETGDAGGLPMLRPGDASECG